MADTAPEIDEEELLSTNRTWFEDWLTETEEEREAACKDRDYYDHKQWTDEEITELNERGQPVITINKIHKKINTLLGYEVRTRVDPKTLPRTPAHEDAAVAATDALRFVTEKERFNERIRARMAKNLLIEGTCGCVVGAEQTRKEIEVKIRPVEWDRLYWDPHSRADDFEDALYRGIVLWMDAEEAKRRYPDAKDLIDQTLSHSLDKSSSQTTDDQPRYADIKRNRVQVFETYWQQDGVWWVGHWVQQGFVDGPAPVGFVDEDGEPECPLRMRSLFVDRDNGRYGLVRAMISLQDELNKRRSKSLDLLTRRNVIYERDAVESIDTAMHELSKSGGAVEVQNPGARFEVVEQGDLTAGHFQLMQHAGSEIDSVGPDTSTITSLPGDASGRAVMARQSAASMELEPFTEALRGIQHEVYTHCFHRVRQYKTEEWWIRVRDDVERKGFRFVALNKPMTKAERFRDLAGKGLEIPNALQQAGAFQLIPVASQIAQAIQAQLQQAMQSGLQVPPEQAGDLVKQEVVSQLMQAPELREKITDNDIASLDVDIVLDVTPDTAVIQQEEFQELGTFVQAGVPIPPDVIIEASSFRNKRVLLERLQQQQQQDPAAAQAAKIQIEQQQANVTATQAKAQKDEAQAIKASVEAGVTAAPV